MPSVFHYTNAAGFLGILTSQSLWATDYRCLNDSSEGHVIKPLLVSIFEKEIARIYAILAEKKLLQGYYEVHGTSGHAREAEGMYSALVRTVDNVSPVFLLSFCRHDPKEHAYRHGLLSQWRGYGDSGGIAIEFDEDRLDALLKQESGKYAFAGWKSNDVQYKTHHTSIDEKMYRGFAAEQIRSLAEPKLDITDITGKVDTDEIVQKFVLTASFLKDQGFAEEMEYRIALPRVAQHHVNPKSELKEKPIKFRSKNGLMVPYIELFSEIKGDLPILSIIVGPHPMQDQQTSAIRMALSGTPFSTAKVRKSEIPYRR